MGSTSQDEVAFRGWATTIANLRDVLFENGYCEWIRQITETDAGAQRALEVVRSQDVEEMSRFLIEFASRRQHQAEAHSFQTYLRTGLRDKLFEHHFADSKSCETAYIAAVEEIVSSICSREIRAESFDEMLESCRDARRLLASLEASDVGPNGRFATIMWRIGICVQNLALHENLAHLIPSLVAKCNEMSMHWVLRQLVITDLCIIENALKTIKAQSEDAAEESPDGPHGGRFVRWKGKDHEVPKGRVFLFIDYMWNRQSATFDSLFDRAVFDHAVEVGTIRSLASKAGQALEAIGIPWQIAVDRVSRNVVKKGTDE